MQFDKKALIMTALGIVVITSSNIWSRALYTNNKIGIDKTTAMISGAIAIGSLYYLLTQIK